MSQEFLTIVLNVLSLGALLAGAFAYSRSKLPAETIKLYQENQAAQTLRIDTLISELNDAKVKLATLDEQLRVIKDLPLHTIAESLNKVLETQNIMLETQNRILQTLEAN